MTEHKEVKKKELKSEKPISIFEKLFGGINLTWPRLIIAAVLIGVFVGILMTIPIFKDTSITRIGAILYWWVLFGTIIIMNSKSNVDSALKCFVFFLISQPIIYLVQVPFSEMGWGLFGYYGYWFKWTLATLPMGFVGYWIKDQKIWSPFILGAAIALVLLEMIGEFSDSKLILSGIFCLAIAIVMLGALRSWKHRAIALVVAIIFAFAFAYINRAKPEDYIFGLTYDVSKYNITTEKEWTVESDLGERATLEKDPVYDEEGNETGETVYTFHVRGNGYDFGTHHFKFIAPDEERNCTLEIVAENMSEKELICE